MVWENPEVSMWENGDDLFYHSNMFILCIYRFGSGQKCSWTERIWKNLCMYSYVFSVGQFFLMYTFVPVSINVSIHSNIISQSLWLCHLPVSFIMSFVSIHSNIIRQSLWLCHLPVSFIMSVVSIHSYITRQSLWLCHRPVSFIMSCTC